jgi:hypothetical protein
MDQSYSLILQGPIRTNSPAQIIGPMTDPLTDYWIDFESEYGLEKVLQLATILVQVVIDQSYSLTPQGTIRTKSPIPSYCNRNT